MTTLLTLAVAALGGMQANRIDDYLQTDLHDATIVAKVVKGDQRELKKINNDFGQSYRFTTSTAYLKEPFKIRVEAHVDETNVLYVINGTNMLMKLPTVSYHESVAKAPGRRQTWMDFGILTPSILSSLFDAKFVRQDRETGDVVFDLTYKPELDDTSRDRVWIDPKKKLITQRQWFNQYGRELATFYYKNPQEVNGVWVPTRMEVKNVEGVVAGIMGYDSIKVNTGLPDSLFVTK